MLAHLSVQIPKHGLLIHIPHFEQREQPKHNLNIFLVLIWRAKSENFSPLRIVVELLKLFDNLAAINRVSDLLRFQPGTTGVQPLKNVEYAVIPPTWF
jgi:hypothetical protein